VAAALVSTYGVRHLVSHSPYLTRLKALVITRKTTELGRDHRWQRREPVRFLVSDNKEMASSPARTSLTTCSLLILLSWSTASGCRRKVSPLASDLKFSAKQVERQLIAGFYSEEGDGWRWTEHRFAVVLAVPPNTRTTGANLQVRLYIPDSQVERLGPMTLTADVNDTELAPETFRKGGSYTYTRTIPPGLLNQSVLPIVFTFDKSLQPRNSDGRELAAVVSEVSLEQPGSLKG
jgi:hypothetical protein